MKTIISITLTISLILSTYTLSVSAVEKQTETDEIERFTEELSEMINDYGNSDFITPSTSVETEEIISEAAVDESDEENTTEDLDIKYLNRLIVQTDSSLETYNAVDVVSGFKNFYILQYANEQDTNYAYEQYLNDEDIISVKYDVAYDALTSVTQSEVTANTTELTYDDYLNDWSLTGTGMDMVLKKYRNSDLPEITVAVIDTGVNLDSVYLKDRIIRTYYNISGDGTENSEQDDIHGHGTTVSSIIMKATTNNVKIANYRIGTDSGQITVSSACNAILKAVSDNIKIINCSFMCFEDDELSYESFKYAYENKCYIFFAAGNRLGNIGITISSPAISCEETICVAASGDHHIPSGTSAYGKTIDITAPGSGVLGLRLAEKFEQVSGTSFASPFMAGVCAMYVATHQRASFEYVHKLMKSCGTGVDSPYVTDYFGSGIVNALKLFELDKVETPTFNYKGGYYTNSLSVEILSESNATIYYTTDNSYPSPTNGFIYSKPIELLNGCSPIKAVAYKDGVKSCFAYEEYYVFTEGTDDMFTITDDGIITSYTGDIKYLKIPEEINGIIVKDFQQDIMADSTFEGLYLPDTVKYIGLTGTNYDRPNMDINTQFAPFYANQTLSLLVGNGIEIIGTFGLSCLPQLARVSFPNCLEIYPEAFGDCHIYGIELPKLKRLWNSAFKNTHYLREVYLPNCEILGNGSFAGCEKLNILYVPNAISINSSNPFEGTEMEFDISGLLNNTEQLMSIRLEQLTNIDEDTFTSSAVKILELSNTQTILDLPSTTYTNSGNENSLYWSNLWKEPIELVFPSTLESCVSASSYKREWNSYVVYGTAGTYAEQWAAENSIPFYEISQETAIREDIETYWDKYSWHPLEFDARGFNRTYQWYGSYDNAIGNDKLISGATGSSFNPDDYEAYPYYYCMMTSTDGDSVVNINSSLCQNRLYYIYDIAGTTIDYVSKYIFTTITAQTNIDNIVGVQDTTTYFYVPSYIYRKNRYYGTGSTLEVYADDDIVQIYTLIVHGDVNGDSAVDVLDAVDVQRASTNHIELTDDYLLAADTDFDGEISVYDYAQVVNIIVNGG